MARTALVTGGGVRLGSAICRKLANDGYTIYIHYHKSETEAADTARRCGALGARVELVQADLEDPEQVKTLCAEACSERLDLLINNAAVFFPNPTLNDSMAAWDHVLNVNLRAAFLCSLYCAPALKARKGSIINVADIYGEFPLKSYVPYCVSKAGLDMLTRSLAVELAPEIRVNGVAPGAVLLGPNAAPDRAQELIHQTPLQRIGDPQFIADAIAFLAEAEFVTGQVLTVDGGRRINL